MAKLTARQKALNATIRDMKKHETVKVYVGRTYTTDDCADLVAPLSKPEIDIIRKSVKFIKGNEAVKCVYLDIRNPHICDDLEKVIGEENYEEHEANNWSVIPIKKYNAMYAECFTQSDETCRIKVWVGDEDGLTHVNLIVGYDDEANAQAAEIFVGKRF
jgi:hypothetical protein